MAFLLYLSFAIPILVLIDRFHLRGERRILAGLLILPLLLTGRALLTDRVYAPADILYSAQPHEPHAVAHGIGAVATPALSDIPSLMIPWRAAVRDSISRGEWPLWNPYMLAGDILQGASEPAPYHPLRLLSLLLPLDLSLTFEAAAFLFIFATSMYLFLRGKQVSPLAALIGATIWCFSDFLTFYLEYPMGAAVGILPLVLFAIDRLFARVRFSMLFLMASFTLVILAGHPESTLHVVAISIVYFIVKMIQARSLATLPAGIAAGLLATGVSAVFLLPFLEALPQTMEFTLRETTGASVSVGGEESARRLLSSFVPLIRGDGKREVAHGLQWKGDLWSGFSGYTGWLLFAGGAFALGRRSIPWVAVAAAGLLTGVQTRGVMEALSMLPLFDIALNERLVFLVPFAIAGLAAMSIDHLARKNVRAVAAAAGAFALIATAIAWHSAEAYGLTSAFRNVNLLVAAATIGTFIVAITSIRSNRIAAVAVLAILATERVAYRASFHPTMDRAAFYPELPMLKTIRESSNGERMVAAGFTLVPNIPTMYGLRDVRGFEGMTNRRLYETFPLWSTHQPVWFNRVDRLDSPMLSMMNVRFALAPVDREVPTGWRTVRAEHGLKIVENHSALPAVFAPGQIRFTPGAKSIEELGAVEDFGSVSLIESDRDQTIDNDAEILGWKRKGSGYRIDVRSAREGWIVVSETAWKGWRAVAGGLPIPVDYANHAFIGLRVPAGTSQIELDYFPRSFVLGGVISTLSLILCAFLIRPVRRTRLAAVVVVFFVTSTGFAGTWVAPVAGNIQSGDGSSFSTTVHTKPITFEVFDAGTSRGRRRTAEEVEQRTGPLSALESRRPFGVVIEHRRADGALAGFLRYEAIRDVTSLRGGDEVRFDVAAEGFRTNLAIFESSGLAATVEIESRRPGMLPALQRWTLSGHEMRFLPMPAETATRVRVVRGPGRVAASTFLTNDASGALAMGAATVQRKTMKQPVIYYGALFAILVLAIAGDRFRRDRKFAGSGRLDDQR